MNCRTLVAILLLSCGVGTARADAAADGEVKLPLDVYTRLLQQVQNPQATPRPPAGYALGQASIRVRVNQDDGQRSVAAVEVQLPIDVLQDEWTAVVLLPAGTAVDAVQVDGEAAQLITLAEGLMWATNKRGTYQMTLRYRVDPQHTESGVYLDVPIPGAASAVFEALLPAADLAVSLSPAAGVRSSESDDAVRVSGTIPATNSVQLAWHDRSSSAYVISRAAYNGTLTKDAVNWTAQFMVELTTGQSVTLPLLPTTITLSDVRVDGKNAAILVDGDRFATRIQGRGAHSVVANFHVAVDTAGGLPKVSFAVPQIPISRFDLTMDGKKEVKVVPEANVVYTHEKDKTVATLYLPMTTSVELGWTEAVPEVVAAEKRVDATFFHAVYAEEGVVFVQASVTFDVTRGETNVLELEIPSDVQVSRIDSPSGAISDWRIADGDGKGRRATVFLDRQWQGPIELHIEYDRSLPNDGKFSVPLLRAHDVHRQRGSVALLSSREWTLDPVDEAQVTRIGENQIPAPMREALVLKVAHSFKYIDGEPRLVVAAAAPERMQGKFDAQVDTLVSLADVTLKGSTSIEVNVKSGALGQLRLGLPSKVNLLSLTAPSQRSHAVVAAEDGQQAVELQFTQDMEGQFRIELAYERILADADAPAAVPVVKVHGAEVEQGRVAIEALSAVEVQTAAVQHLTSIDPSDLPQQLVLKTTNPILLAYKYVHTEPLPGLTLKLTRHQAIEVQAATIDEAIYRTLVTRDGLAVTAADLTMRNSREQFLRLQLPAGSQVWAAFVNGVAEKPALADGGGVLVKIINSAQGFPVRLIYATPIGALGRAGRLSAELPRPQMVVTRTRWEVYLPDGLSYGRIDSNMEGGDDLTPLAHDLMQAEFGRMKLAEAQVIAPLQIDVPTSGVRIAFKKLYANQGESPASFSIAYMSRFGWWVGTGLSAVATLMFWAGTCLVVLQRRLRLAPLLALVGLGVNGLLLGYFGLGVSAVLVASVGGGVGLYASYRTSYGRVAPSAVASLG